MICTCKKCNRNFFPENHDSPIVCPECGGEVATRTNWSELHYLVDLLAEGEIREALEPYSNTQPEKAPALMDVAERINEILQSLPRDIRDRYSMELSDIIMHLARYFNDDYYELTHRRGTAKIETTGKKIWMRLFSLEQKLSNNRPGAAEQMMPWAFEAPRRTRKLIECIPGTEAAFKHFMPTIPTPFPTVNYSQKDGYRTIRERLLKETGCTLKTWPDDSMMEYIHGSKGGTILIRIDLLPDGFGSENFIHAYWHELGHFYAINADTHNLERFDDPDSVPDETDATFKQRGYWFWQEFIAEAIANYVDFKVRSAEPTYHPENIDWAVDTWSPTLERLQRLLDDTFLPTYLDEYNLAHYFAMLLMDDLTMLYVKAAEEGKLKRYGKDIPAAPGEIDATCIDELDPMLEEDMTNMKSWLEGKMKEEKFWEIDENDLRYLGGLIIKMESMNKRLYEE